MPGGHTQRLEAQSVYALATFPLLMQLAQTRSLFDVPFTIALTACKFTFQRRRVMLCACEMLLPKRGPLPQISQVCAMIQLQISLVFSGAALAATTLTAPRAIALPNLQYISYWRRLSGLMQCYGANGIPANSEIASWRSSSPRYRCCPRRRVSHPRKDAGRFAQLQLAQRQITWPAAPEQQLVEARPHLE